MNKLYFRDLAYLVDIGHYYFKAEVVLRDLACGNAEVGSLLFFGLEDKLHLLCLSEICIGRHKSVFVARKKSVHRQGRWIYIGYLLLAQIQLERI